jgi:signal peptidase I
MELRLLIIGIISFIFAKLSKRLKKKNFFNAKSRFILWNIAFVLMAGGMAYYLLNFMAANGIEGGLSERTFALIVTATVALAFYYFNKSKKADDKQRDKLFVYNLEWAETVYFAAFFASFVMFFFMQAFQIPTGSMRNTLLEKDNLFVNKLLYGVRLPFMKEKLIKFRDIKRGDVIVFRFPAENKGQINCGGPQYGRDFVKRVIGLPGETVEIKNKQVFINGEPLPAENYELYDNRERPKANVSLSQYQYQELWENRELEKVLGLYIRDYFGPIKIPEKTYLGIGDNRDHSCDSRFWGPIPEENIKGKAWFIHWPLSRIGIIR